MEESNNQRYKVRFLLLGFLVLALVVLFIVRLIGFDGLYGQDAHEYARYGKELKIFFLTGVQPKDFFWPIYFSFFGALLDLIINDISWSLQLLSILSWAGTGVVSYLALEKLYGIENTKLKLLFTISFISFSPYFIRFGVSGMSDVLCTFFVVLTFYFSTLF